MAVLAHVLKDCQNSLQIATEVIKSLMEHTLVFRSKEFRWMDGFCVSVGVLRTTGSCPMFLNKDHNKWLPR